MRVCAYGLSIAVTHSCTHETERADALVPEHCLGCICSYPCMYVWVILRQACQMHSCRCVHTCVHTSEETLMHKRIRTQAAMQQQGLAVTVSGITTQVDTPGQSSALQAPESSNNASATIAAVAGALGSVVALTVAVCLALFIVKRKNAKIDPSGLPVTYETKSATNVSAEERQPEPSGNAGSRMPANDTGAATVRKQKPFVGAAESQVIEGSICVCMHVSIHDCACPSISTLVTLTCALSTFACIKILGSVHVLMRAHFTCHHHACTSRFTTLCAWPVQTHADQICSL
jgi:hypothetical protein